METTSLLHDPAFWLLVLFAIPLILRVPIALALGFSALVVVWQWDLGFSMLSYNFFAGIAKFPLLVSPSSSLPAISWSVPASLRASWP